MSPTLWRAIALSSLLVLSGCGTVGGWFSGDEEDPTAPVALTDIEERVRIDKLWSTGVGNGQGTGLYRIHPVISGDTLFAAAADGSVRAIDRRDGKTLWKADMDTDLSGGVGIHADTLLLGSSEGEVLAVDAATGKRLWSTRLQGEVLAPPQADGDVVVAQTYDGKLQGLDFASGELRWTYDSDVPVLTVRGTSAPILRDDVVYAGFANGRVLAFDADTGDVRWEVRVAISQGRSEIERIVDVDGTMDLQSGELYAASYQGRLAAVDVRAGQRLWQQDVSSVSGVSTGFGNVYVADEDGTVYAYLRSGGGVRWSQEALGYRGLSRPTPVSSYLAVADFEGYLHILSQVDGQIIGRVRVDSDGARADMLSDGNVLYVYGNSGKLVAYEITART
ncbi:MAG: outer membrane protein assembly factor BamB [Halioglobus sp.]|nr:outer membrane protein assembly factor BamB [Halioglobus sp.]